MKPNEKKNTIISTLEGEDIEMKFDEKSIVHLMSLMIDMYSNKILAVIREYSTNAHESHIESGQTRPIDISLPGVFSPTLKIKDYGLGLNKEDIKRVYSLYGASTKRGTNDVGGMLGLGCKSALTYSDQFTVIGIKDGVKTIVSVSRDEKGAGHMKIVKEEETDEPNGVEITIPVKQADTAQFKKTADEFFKYWPEGSVLVDGSAPKKIEVDETALVLSENMFAVMSTNTYYGNNRKHKIVQGNIAYPFEFEGFSPYQLVVYVPVGTVDFVPSREELQFTTRTKEALSKIEKEYEELVKTAVEKEIDSCKTKNEALLKKKEFDKFRVPIIRYKNEEIPSTMQFSDPIDYGDDSCFFICYRTFGTKNERLSYREKTLSLNYHSEKIFITDYPNKSFTRVHRDKIVKYFANESPPINTSQIILIHGKPNNLDWLNQDNLISWDEIKDINVEQTAAKTTPTYDVMYLDGTYDIQTEIDDSYTLLYYDQHDLAAIARTAYQREDERRVTVSRIVADLKKITKKKIAVVCFFEKRKKKFLRTYPKAKPINDFIRETIKEWWDTLDQKNKSLLLWNPILVESLNRLSASAQKVSDEDLKIVIKDFNKRKELMKQGAEQKLVVYNKYVLQAKAEDYKTEMEVKQKYQLLGSNAGTKDVDTEHLLLYVNSIHEKEKANV